MLTGLSFMDVKQLSLMNWFPGASDQAYIYRSQARKLSLTVILCFPEKARGEKS